MATEQREFKFPDEVEEKIEVEETPELEIVDDTPEPDRGRKPADEPPKEFSDDELETYNDSVKKRIKHSPRDITMNAVQKKRPTVSAKKL